MPDETVNALQEIAGLLRRRVEQQDEMFKRSEERMVKLDVQKAAIPDVAKIREDGEKRR